MPFYRKDPDSGGDLGKAIKEIRFRADLNQTEAARQIGVDRTTVSQYETGRAKPSAERLIILLRFARTVDERRPILDALSSYGVLASDLSPALTRSSTESACDEHNQISISGNEISADRDIS